MTRTPIRVEISPAGLDHVEPAGAVVAVLDPSARELQSMTDAEQANLEVCSQQPLFASQSAATAWSAAHPGSRLFTTSEFLDWWRDHLRRMDLIWAADEHWQHEPRSRGATGQKTARF